MVELLAVVVILAIIGLIIMPMILRNIERSKINTYKSNVQTLIDAAKQYVTKNMEDNDFPEGGINVNVLDTKLADIKSGTIRKCDDALIDEIECTEGEIIAYKIYNGTYCASGKKQSIIVEKVDSEEKCKDIDITPPTLKVRAIKVTNDSIMVNAYGSDAQTPIKRYTFKIGDSKEYEFKTNKKIATYEFTKLKANTEYEIEVSVENSNADDLGYEGNAEAYKRTETIKVKTAATNVPKFKITGNSYADSKEITIIYPKIKNGVNSYKITYFDDEETTEEKTDVEQEVKLTIDKNCRIEATTLINGEELTNSLNVIGIDKDGPYLEVVMDASWENKKSIELIAIDTGSGLSSKPYSFNSGKKWQAKGTTSIKGDQKVYPAARDKLGNITTKYIICKKKDANGRGTDCLLPRDLDGDGVCDVNCDMDGYPGMNVDSNHDGICDWNCDDDGDGICDRKCGTDGLPKLNVDFDGDGKCDWKCDDDGDGVCDRYCGFHDGDGYPETNMDWDGDGKCDWNCDNGGYDGTSNGGSGSGSGGSGSGGSGNSSCVGSNCKCSSTNCSCTGKNCVCDGSACGCAGSDCICKGSSCKSGTPGDGKCDTKCTSDTDPLPTPSLDTVAPTCKLKVSSGTYSKTMSETLNGKLVDRAWYRSNISIVYDSVRDTSLDPLGNEVEGSGVDTKTINITSITADGRYTIEGTVRDKAGNTGHCYLYVGKDTVAPTCSLRVASGTLGNNGWYRSNVTIGWNTSNDSMSGVSSKQINTPSITADGRNTVTGTIYDNAGNVGTCSLVVNKDTVAPSISTSVSTGCPSYLTTYCSDGMSGAVSSSYQNSYSSAATPTTTCTDYAGNSSSKSTSVSVSCYSGSSGSSSGGGSSDSGISIGHYEGSVGGNDCYSTSNGGAFSVSNGGNAGSTSNSSGGYSGGGHVTGSSS